jgi:hypothetical protein
MVLTGQSGFVEHFACFTGDKSGMAVDAGDEAAAVSRDSKAGKRKEFGGDRMGWHVVGALEPNDG